MIETKKKLPDGIYRIPFENIYSNKLAFDIDKYTIHIELNNDIDIDNYNVKFYGLYDYKMNLIIDTINTINFKFSSNNHMQIYNIYQ